MAHLTLRHMVAAEKVEEDSDLCAYPSVLHATDLGRAFNHMQLWGVRGLNHATTRDMGTKLICASTDASFLPYLYLVKSVWHCESAAQALLREKGWGDEDEEDGRMLTSCAKAAERVCVVDVVNMSGQRLAVRRN